MGFNSCTNFPFLWIVHFAYCSHIVYALLHLYFFSPVRQREIRSQKLVGLFKYKNEPSTYLLLVYLAVQFPTF